MRLPNWPKRQSPSQDFVIKDFDNRQLLGGQFLKSNLTVIPIFAPLLRDGYYSVLSQSQSQPSYTTRVCFSRDICFYELIPFLKKMDEF